MRFFLSCRAAFALCAATLLLLAVPASGQRPYWPLSGDEEALRERLQEWVVLDEAAAREKAKEWAADPGKNLANVAENLAALASASGGESDARLAGAALDELIAPAIEAADGDPAGAVTRQGSKDRTNLRVRDLAFWLAMRYAVRGDADDAGQAKRILLRFAEVVPDWPMWDASGQEQAQDDRAYRRRSHSRGGRGLWGRDRWRDLAQTFPLLRAYDLVHGHLSPEEREAVEENVFRRHKRLSDHWHYFFFNMEYNHMLALIRFGLTLPDPDWIHEVVDMYRLKANCAFYPDGMYREVSVCYHNMPVSRMLGSIPRLLEGYSDPPGYRHPNTGERFDGLGLAGDFARHHARWRASRDKFTLPNRARLAVNDGHARNRGWYTPEDQAHTAPRLLGASGVAMLGAGEEANPLQVFLLFADTHGHEHADGLNIVWFAHGREAFSETDYLPSDPDIPRSEGRRWNSSTAGHNTVVIDETNQPGRGPGEDQRTLTRDDAMFGITWPFRWRAMHQGNLLLFDPGWPEVQAMEAEAERTYTPLADLYRRTLAMVDLGGGDGYLVDIFRVRGGGRHDYMLHGCLNEAYGFETDADLEAAKGTIHEFIALHGRAEARPPFSFSFLYPDGTRTVSRILSPTAPDATGSAGAEFNVGRAPAMRRPGTAEFVALRRQGEEEVNRPGQDNAFVLVHEAASDGNMKIRSAGLLPIAETDDPEAVALRVTLANGREDVFVSTLGGGTVVLEDGTRFQGRLAYLRREGGRTTAARVFDGRSLVSGDGAARIGNLPEIGGRVVATRRLDKGDGADGVVVQGLPEGAGGLEGRTLFVEMDEGRDYVWAYRIVGVEADGDGTLLLTAHDPGFEVGKEALREHAAPRDMRPADRFFSEYVWDDIDQQAEAIEDFTKLVFFPGWGFRSPAYWRVGSVGHWEAE